MVLAIYYVWVHICDNYNHSPDHVPYNPYCNKVISAQPSTVIIMLHVKIIYFNDVCVDNDFALASLGILICHHYIDICSTNYY